MEIKMLQLNPEDLADNTQKPLHPLVKAQISELSQNYRLTPATMAHKLESGWLPAQHLLKVSQIVTNAILNGDGRVLISFPPRHGKSKLITSLGTTWYLENFPTKSVVLGSYGAALSTGFSREIRDRFIESQHLLTTRVNPDVSNVNEWHTTKGGKCIAVGIGGALTGKGADLLVIDDYLKDAVESESEDTKEKVYDWFKSVAYTRLAPGATVIVIATRWAQNDLIGRILEDDTDNKWRYVEFPAIADSDNDVLGRKRGEPLFPERFTTDKLEDIKETLGSYFFDALYQQKPRKKGDLQVNRDWFKIVDSLPTDLVAVWCRMWDFAASEKKGDWAAGVLAAWSASTKTFYVVDIAREQRKSAGLEVMVKDCARQDGVGIPVHIEQEPGSSGKIVIDMYNRTVLPQHTVKAYPSSGSKLVKAQAFLAAAEAGNVRILKASWNTKFLDEVESFPKAKHDDQVDAASGAFNVLVSPGTFSAVWGRNKHVASSANSVDTRNNKFGVVFGRKRG